MSGFKSEIVEHSLTLSESNKGWAKELGRANFNGAKPKLDIRSQNPDHSKMGKDVTLTNEEFRIILDAFRG